MSQEQFRPLIEAAQQARQHSVAPFSEFLVGAAVMITQAPKNVSEGTRASPDLEDLARECRSIEALVVRPGFGRVE